MLSNVLQSLTRDLLDYLTGLPAPDNEYHATSASQTFTGLNGEVDHFIFDTDINGGNYLVNNYEPGSDWLIFTVSPGDSVETSANDDHATYTNRTDSTYGHVEVNGVGTASGISIATITGGGLSSPDLGLTKSIWGTTARDTLIGDNSRDKIYGRNSTDVLRGMGGNDVLDGGRGRDKLFGGDGKDILMGGSGPSADFLWGEAGADVFRFSQITHSAVGRNRDQIKDFNSAQHDRIDLRGIDANLTEPGNQAFRYIDKAEFSHKSGELRYANHILSGDVDGNGAADFEIRVNAAKLAKYDFIL